MRLKINVHHFDGCTASELLVRDSAMHVLNMNNNYCYTIKTKEKNVTFKCPTALRYPKTNPQTERRGPLSCITVLVFEDGYPGCRFS
jgi:hypothetical protein